MVCVRKKLKSNKKLNEKHNMLVVSKELETLIARKIIKHEKPNLLALNLSIRARISGDIILHLSNRN